MRSADPRVGAVVPRLLNTDGTLQPSCICAPRPFDLISEDLALAGVSRTGAGRAGTACSIGTTPKLGRWMRRRGACLFMRRAALADVGLFDERFFVYYEETDWLIRAKRRGWRTVFLPTVEAVHAGAGSSPGVRSPHDPAASREPASLRAEALRAGEDGAPSRDAARNRHCTPRPPRARRQTPSEGRGARPHPRAPDACARPGPPSRLEVSYTRSLDAWIAADWRGLAERAGHVFATREWLSHGGVITGRRGRQLIGLARAGGDLVAIVPLYEWWKRGIPVLRFVGHGPSDRLGPDLRAAVRARGRRRRQRGHRTRFRCGASCCSPSTSPATSVSAS